MTTPRGSTPNLSKKIENVVLQVPKNNVPRNTSVEAFPEFPRPTNEFDTMSMMDDTLSVATSIEDETNFDYDVVAADDPFGMPDVAEEAVTIDEHIISDRIFKSIMAKVGNLLVVNLDGIKIVGNVHNGELLIDGGVQNVELSHRLSIVRQEANDMLKKIALAQKYIRTDLPNIVNFQLRAPADNPTSFLDANIKGLKASLDDEIITHLSAFALDDQVSDNKVRLNVQLSDSNIEIVDRKKKKPLKLKITSLTLEQEED
ncbi:unnamed protein product [Caenorhabditis angaria]|uniref:Uncharacterized protein n=1 Tax=Caenorhabditis angaria TaxID=860376 RepID=A0A9P1J309_9PELO|nr:unnamed protein product [Caenorhabditis angaria]